VVRIYINMYIYTGIVVYKYIDIHGGGEGGGENDRAYYPG